MARSEHGLDGRARPTCARRPRRGFTVPEMVVVMFVIGVLGVLVVPQMEVVRFRMDGSARGYVAVMVAAQRVAVKRQHDVIVRIDVANRAISIHEDADNDGEIEDGERVRHVPLDEGVVFGMGSATPRTPYFSTITFDPGADGVPQVRFIRSGSASQDGAFYLTSRRSAAGDGYAGDARMVQVDRATGRASWYHFDPPEWKHGF